MPVTAATSSTLSICPFSLNKYMRRPLAAFCFAWTFTQLIFIQSPQAAWLLGGIFFVLSLYVLARTQYRQNSTRILVASAGAIAALLWITAAELLVLPNLTAFCGRTMQVEAKIITVDSSDENGFAVLQLLKADGHRVPMAPRVGMAGFAGSEAGELVSASLRFVSDNRAMLAQGQYLSAEAVEAPVVTGISRSLTDRLARLGGQLSFTLKSQLQPEPGALAAAICTGDKSALTDRLVLESQRAGLSHLLAVSGMHLSVVTGLLLALLPRGKRLLRLVCGTAGIVAFSALSGASPSVLRAGAMLFLVLLADLISTETDPLTSVGFVLFCMTLTNPYRAANPGLLLSCAATLGVLLAGEAIDSLWCRVKDAPTPLKKAGLRVLPHLLVPLAASAATLPILIALGWGVSLWALPANFLATPVLPYLMGSGLAGAALYSVFPLGGRVLMGICGFLCRWVIGVARFFSGFENGYWSIRGGYAILVLCFLAAFSVLIFRAPKRRALCVFTVLLSFWAILLSVILSANTVKAALIKSGSSPAVVITQNRKAAVIWSGGSRDTDILESYLAQQNVRELTLLCDLSDETAIRPILQWYQPKNYQKPQEKGKQTVTFAPFDDIIITVQLQKEGSFALIETGGFRLLAPVGQVNASQLGAVDACFAVPKEPVGLLTNRVLAGEQIPVWAWSQPEKLVSGPAPTAFLRPAGAVSYRKGGLFS